MYETRVYEVDPYDGGISDRLPTFYWYDADGRIIKTAVGAMYSGTAYTGYWLLQKYAYDGLGRLVDSYTCYDTDETSYTDAVDPDLTGDTVVEQTHTWYDAADQAVASAVYQRLPDPFTTSIGPLNATDSYVTVSRTWYDGLGRMVATANYGREDVVSGTDTDFFNHTDGSLIDANSNSIPDILEGSAPSTYTSNGNSSGDAYIVALYEYNPAGYAYKTKDNLGRINETLYDAAGRTVLTIQNYVASGFTSDPAVGDSDAQVAAKIKETSTTEDITVKYDYDSAGRLVTMIAYNAKGDDNDPYNENVEQQATRYLYESPINASWQTAVIYPDSEDSLTQDANGVWTFDENGDLGDHVSTAYDRLGRTTSTTDQRGVVHEYTYDSAGRLSADEVDLTGEHTGQNVDGSVMAIVKTYDDVGRVKTVTSYCDTGFTYAVNKVEYVYDGWGNVVDEYQEHYDGWGNVIGEYQYYGPGGVHYVYDDGASGGVAKYVRLADVTYPSGREIDCGYTGAVDDIMSRLTDVGDGTDVYASYKYLGANTIVEEDYEDIDMKLSYLDISGNVTGLDRFGRVVDQVWIDYGANPDEVIDEYTYTYDREGNRTAKTNVLKTDHSLDETYEYNDLDELISTVRNNGFDQSWDLDSLGNWSEFDDDGSTQTREVNEANEIQTINSSQTVNYDAAGNMLSDGTLKYKYDAWNRQTYVTLADDSPVASYVYDGLGRRVQKNVLTGGPYLTQPEYYYNDKWQLIEERSVMYDGFVLSSYQYVWSPRYVDSPVVRFYDFDVPNNPEVHTAVYYTTDANHNVTSLVNASGAVVERYYYDPYGKATICNASWQPLHATGFLLLGLRWNDGGWSAYGNEILYCGYFYDSETSQNASVTIGTSGNYCVRHRYLSTQLGLFISRDPIGYKGGINLYEYVGNDPTNFVDPSGLQYNTIPGPSGSYGISGGSCKTRTNKECCDAANSKGMDHGAYGGIICCDGRKVECAWKDSATGVTDPTGIEISRKCILTHEKTHNDDINCDPKKNLERPLFKPGKNQDTEECEAYKVHVKCLQDGLKDCKGDAKCEDQIKKEIKKREEMRDYWCGKIKKTS